jgi:hypothetical protein
MPRSSAGASSSKRQGLHHHHSNGLVPPVKRPSRSGSTSNGSVVSTTASPNPSPSQQVAAAANQFQPATANGGVTNGYANGWDGKAPGRRYSDGLESDLSEGFQNSVNGAGTAEHRQIDINPSGKTTVMTSRVPSTVLSSFPLLDTITLLIIFLQLPSTVLTIIHFLFASLTFVPPSTTLLSASTTSSLPSLTNLLLQGSNGAPSLLTIIFADILVALLSMFLWPSARVFLIDFAQAVIAISMGAGHATQSGGTLRNAVVCAGVMGGVKVVQGRFKLSDAWDGIQPHSESFLGGPSSELVGRIGSSAGWIRSAIAIHIVAQGVMRATRRWLIGRPDTTDASTPNLTNSKEPLPLGKQKDKDPEAAAGALSQPLERESSTAGTSGGRRKKKNQIQHIRDNQPLWATMASAIVHIAKEVEQSQISSEASISNPIETGATNDSALSNGEDVRVWITKIGSTDIGFSASFFGAKSGGEEMYGMNGVVTNGTDGSGKDGTFPLFVRVNGIVWPQTDIYKATGSGDIDGENGEAMGVAEDEWTIDITGLTGATEYDFEFVKKGLQVVYKTSACTIPAAQGMCIDTQILIELGSDLVLASSAAAPAATQQQPSRPLSPITTLLNTLAQANSCLLEQKNRLKVVKKTHKGTLSDIRKEIEKHRSLLGNDRGEERAFRRNLALKEAIKRAEEENEKMLRELSELENVPETMKAEWKEKKRLWREERSRLLTAQNQAGEAKAAADRQAQAVESETASLATKKERLSAKLTKLRADLEKAGQEISQEAEAREKRQLGREALQAHRTSLEKEFTEAIYRMEVKMHEHHLKSQENWAAYRASEAALLQQQQSQLPPSTPDGLHSNHGSMHVATPPGLVLQNQHAPISTPNNRERSMSIFSDGSVITNMSELERSESLQNPNYDIGSNSGHGSLGQIATSFPPPGLMGVFMPERRS